MMKFLLKKLKLHSILTVVKSSNSCHCYNLAKTFSSALYITGNKAQKTFSVLTPYIDFDDRVKNKNELVDNINIRNLSINIADVEKSWTYYKNIVERKKILDKTRTEIGKELSELKSKVGVEDKEIKKLLSHAKMIKEDLKTLKEYMYDIEERAVIKILSLPNVLHERTPHSYPETLYKFLEKTNTKSQHHLEIAKTNDLIEYHDSCYYFLKHDCALFELNVLDHFQKYLLNALFTEFDNPDFVRSVIIEGCGGNFQNPDEFFILEDPHDSNQELSRLHLVGGSSLYSFMSYFTRHAVQTSYFPLKFFTIGRKYKPPINNDQSLFNVSQETAIDFFVATEDCHKAQNSQLNNIISTMKSLYDALGHHYIMVAEPAPKLKLHESLRISLKMFSCALQQYVEVAHISACDSYLSKRLLCTYTEEKERRFPKVVCGTFVSIQKLLGCILENNSSNNKDLLWINIV